MSKKVEEDRELSPVGSTAKKSDQQITTAASSPSPVAVDDVQPRSPPTSTPTPTFAARAPAISSPTPEDLPENESLLLLMRRKKSTLVEDEAEKEYLRDEMEREPNDETHQVAYARHLAETNCASDDILALLKVKAVQTCSFLALQFYYICMRHTNVATRGFIICN